MLKDDDEDRENEEVGDLDEHLLKCLCCKEVGHLIDTCPRDPNLRTKSNLENEYIRVAKAKDSKKVFADTHIQTAHMLKKCVIVPVKLLKKECVANSSFRRGVMEFEDFNYAVYNPHILIEEREGAILDQRKEVKLVEKDVVHLKLPVYEQKVIVLKRAS